MNPATYTLPEALLQAVVEQLNDLPAGRSRGLLNALEAEVRRQDAERADAQAARARASLADEIRAEMQTPAPAP